jgi:hypothetical protein
MLQPVMGCVLGLRSEGMPCCGCEMNRASMVRSGAAFFSGLL